MKVSDAFPSRWLSASDLNGGNARVTISRVEIEKIGDDTKPVIYFKGKTKGLVANKTNSKAIADVYGDEMDDWPGNEIILFPITTDFQGKMVEAIRVRAPTAKDNPKPVRQSSAEMGRDDFPGDKPLRQAGVGHDLPRDEVGF